MSQIYPVITLYQPWATWIMWGWKTIETRTHNRFACLNGKEILIHASLTYDNFAMPNHYLDEIQFRHASDYKHYEKGVILGSAKVIDVGVLTEKHSLPARIDCGDTLIQRYGLFLTDIIPFELPIPAKGGMGIWYFDLETMQKVKK